MDSSMFEILNGLKVAQKTAYEMYEFLAKSLPPNVKLGEFPNNVGSNFRLGFDNKNYELSITVPFDQTEIYETLLMQGDEPLYENGYMDTKRFNTHQEVLEEIERLAN